MKSSIKVKPSFKHRVPHKPTKVHKNKKKYSRRGKAKDRLRRETAVGFDE
jgi:hypothetical protein